MGSSSNAGVFAPGALILAAVSYGIYRGLHRILARAGRYSHVWHPALFDVALYASILSASILFLEHLPT
ncbi:DUF1656 domain-containing protein [Marinibacterium profundimaris]|uniref:DUF1656 domain-containing protein n=1 Tax=Marinibacterium profundimaris TaxID=1679460 RepID=A0A225NKI2_9RHOB|nr:DUF1656 domain-containing protein [Marinibacterium profundimaris]OWU69967.1 hypothetical protein ATO3_21030 [Marinibacterium profundimaris]